MNPGNIAVVEGASTGVITYWSLSGDTDGSALISKWMEQGLSIDLLPQLKEATPCLRRAVKAQTEKHLQAIKQDDGSWWLVRLRTDGDEPETTPTARIVLNDDETRVVVTSPNGYYQPTQLTTMQANIQAMYDHYRNALTTQDISGWLCKLIDAVNGIALRPDTGGFYYIPGGHVETWSRIEVAVEAASGHKIYPIPVVKGDKAAEAVLDALTAEVEKQSKDTMKGIVEGKWGERGLRNRVTETEATSRKVSSYEAMLGVKLDTLRKKMEELNGAIVAAALTAEAETDARKAAR